MKPKLFKATLLIGTTALIFSSCKPEVDAPIPQKGRIDVTKYVSIGNSITAGYADNALYYDAQIVSYPNLIAQQFKMIGADNFIQPLVPATSAGIGFALTLYGPSSNVAGDSIEIDVLFQLCEIHNQVLCQCEVHLLNICQ